MATETKGGVLDLAQRLSFCSRFLLVATISALLWNGSLQAQAAIEERTVPADQIFLQPGGQTVGVKLRTAGVLVVGHHNPEEERTGNQSPAERAQIQLGDIVTAVNGEKVQSVAHFSELVQKFSNEQNANNNKLQLDIVRSGKKTTAWIYPILDKNSQKYRLGIYVRDTAAGIGTLTFYSQDYKVYGALGHMISDAETRVGLTVKDGEILPSEVVSIRKGSKGEPGEKRANIITYQPPYGTIEKNTDFGIFGEWTTKSDVSNGQSKIAIAGRDEVREGPAKILTVIQGQKVESFDIEILRLNKQDVPETRGMVIKVTDPRLLQATGGIVQGMSGSPIIQNGKLVGAVTHVFVNDPQSGYGCYIEWMLRDAGFKLNAA